MNALEQLEQANDTLEDIATELRREISELQAELTRQDDIARDRTDEIRAILRKSDAEFRR